MIVACPSCHARFRLDERRLSRARSVLRCSRCGQTFPAPLRPAAARRSAPPAEGESLSFAFDDEDDWEREPLADAGGEEDFLAPRPQAKPPKRRAPRGSPELILEDDLSAEETLPTVRAERGDDEEGEERPAATISLKPLFVFLLLVVTGYAVFARALYANPKWAADLVGEIPMVGAVPLERSLDSSVALIELLGRHERTKDGGLVFIVTGKAVNRSGSRLRSVQVRTTLFDGGGNVVGRQVTFCGNTVRTDLIRNLTVSQVAILAGLKPPQSFSVQPSGTCPFVGIFTHAPGALASFSTEVAAVQRHG
jgi:predicted Zn finger-like uncharacterized protein